MIYYLKVLLAGCLLFLVGCSNNDFIKKEGEALKTFTTFDAVIGESSDTRAHLENPSETGDINVVWDWDVIYPDEIYVKSDTQSEFSKYELISVDGNVGHFAGEKISGNVFYALYSPQGITINLDENDSNIIHYFAPGGVCLTNYEEKNFWGIMVAQSNDAFFYFKQTIGMIHVSISSAYEVLEVSLKGNNDEYISQNGKIDLSKNNPELLDFIMGEYDKEVSAQFQYFEDNNARNEFYFFIRPTAFEKGFTISISYYDRQGYSRRITKSYTKPINVGRAEVVHFPLLNVGDLLAEEELRGELKKIFEATDGNNWINNTNWNTDAPLSEWYGITTDSEGYVTNINLENNGLIGELSLNLKGLPRLVDINASGNSLTDFSVRSDDIHDSFSLRDYDGNRFGSTNVRNTNIINCNNLNDLFVNSQNLMIDNCNFGNIDNLYIMNCQNLMIDNCNFREEDFNFASYYIENVIISNSKLYMNNLLHGRDGSLGFSSRTLRVENCSISGYWNCYTTDTLEIINSTCPVIEASFLLSFNDDTVIILENAHLIKSNGNENSDITVTATITGSQWYSLFEAEGDNNSGGGDSVAP